MNKEVLEIKNIPAILWGEESGDIHIYVHGNLSDKEEARFFAEKAIPRGSQVLSFAPLNMAAAKKKTIPVWFGIASVTSWP